jgi:pyruvate formate-lyase/glycerol dehydratase family glycyl radical enzyme
MFSLTDIDALPRLAALRQDILDSPYELCAQKARLMTKHLATNRRGIRERIHCRVYRRSLAQLAAGKRQPQWKTRVNRQILRAYRSEAMGPELRMADALAYTLEHAELRAYDHELIVGNLTSRRVGAALHPEYGGLLVIPELDTLPTRAVNPLRVRLEDKVALRRDVLPYWFRRSIMAVAPSYNRDPSFLETVNEGKAYLLTQFAGISHVTPDYRSMLTKGLRGIERELLAGKRSPNRDAMLVSVRAGIAFGHRWYQHLIERADAEGNEDLRRVAELFRRIPEHPAVTFHEALQSLFIAHVMLHQENFQHGISFGRLDQMLAPYYRQDLEAGRITPEGAVELLGCFLCKTAEVLPLFFHRATEFFSGLSSASGITLGPCVNDVSYLLLLAYDQVRLRQPNLHVRVSDETPPEFLNLCAAVLKKGGGMPAFFNDKTIVASQVAAGVSVEHAEEYAVVGCCEWGPAGCSFPAAGAGFINLPHVLDLALRSDTSLNSVEEVLVAFETQLRMLLKEATDGNNAIERAHADHRPTPLLSTLVQGCIDQGLDATQGGAVYNTTGFQGVGLADVADSIAALQQLVFCGSMNLPTFLAVVDSDFQGHAELLSRLQNQVPRYGEDKGAEVFVSQVSTLFRDVLASFSNPRGGPYSAGFWSMTTHQGFGSRTGASPSGRRANTPLSNGISPRLGSERMGPTAALASAAQVADVSNGCVLNTKLDPSHLGGKTGNAILTGLVRGHFALGGQQVQINVVDPEVLRKAQQRPDLYGDLVVRISGYSAYFNDLTEAMQDELIGRASHGAAA